MVCQERKTLGQTTCVFAAVWWLWLLVVLPHHPYRVYGLCQRGLSAFLVFLRKTTNRLLMKHADQLQLGCLWVIEPLWLNVTLVSLGNLYTLTAPEVVQHASCILAPYIHFSVHMQIHMHLQMLAWTVIA